MEWSQTVPLLTLEFRSLIFKRERISLTTSWGFGWPSRMTLLMQTHSSRPPAFFIAVVASWAMFFEFEMEEGLALKTSEAVPSAWGVSKRLPPLPTSAKPLSSSESQLHLMKCRSFWTRVELGEIRPPRNCRSIVDFKVRIDGWDFGLGQREKDNGTNPTQNLSNLKTENASLLLLITRRSST